jgi:hypothetical protein
MPLQLRYYQNEAVDAVFDYWSEEAGNPADRPGYRHRQVVVHGRAYHAPRQRLVGHARHGRNARRGTDRAELSRTAWRVGEWAPAGILSAGLGRYNYGSQIIFGGIQTAHNKAHLIGHIDVLLIDECHLVPFKNDTSYRRFIEELAQGINPDMKVVGLTATPYRLSGGRLDEGDNRLFDRVVYTYGIADGVATATCAACRRFLRPPATICGRRHDGRRLQAGRATKRRRQRRSQPGGGRRGRGQGRRSAVVASVLRRRRPRLPHTRRNPGARHLVRDDHRRTSKDERRHLLHRGLQGVPLQSID